MSILDEVKIALRITTEDFDNLEILPLIDACKLDLQRVGIDTSIDDALVHRAIINYCRGYFGNGERANDFVKAYEALRNSMSLSGDYSANNKSDFN